MLVQIESGEANPSIATLCKLAAALGASVADLVQLSGQHPAEVLPAAAPRLLWRGPKGGTATLLVGSAGPDMLELWSWELRPGERYDAPAHPQRHRGADSRQPGALALAFGEVNYVIAAGGSAVAHTDRPHAYACDGRKPVRVHDGRRGVAQRPRAARLALGGMACPGSRSFAPLLLAIAGSVALPRRREIDSEDLRSSGRVDRPLCDGARRQRPRLRGGPAPVAGDRAVAAVASDDRRGRAGRADDRARASCSLTAARGRSARRRSRPTGWSPSCWSSSATSPSGKRCQRSRSSACCSAWSGSRCCNDRPRPATHTTSTSAGSRSGGSPRREDRRRHPLWRSLRASARPWRRRARRGGG
mgnify:CR=1 FL=1